MAPKTSAIMRGSRSGRGCSGESTVSSSGLEEMGSTRPATRFSTIKPIPASSRPLRGATSAQISGHNFLKFGLRLGRSG